jgi:hypothetical protein
MVARSRPKRRRANAGRGTRVGEGASVDLEQLVRLILAFELDQMGARLDPTAFDVETFPGSVDRFDLEVRAASLEEKSLICPIVASELDDASPVVLGRSGNVHAFAAVPCDHSEHAVADTLNRPPLIILLKAIKLNDLGLIVA